MFMLDLFTWWYRAGWAGVFASTKRRLNGLADMFSLNILLRTLFAPWRRIVTYPGAGLDARIRAFGDNMVSRAIGFTVRLMALFAASVAFVVVGILSLLEIVLWPVVPFAGIALIIKGLL